VVSLAFTFLSRIGRNTTVVCILIVSSIVGSAHAQARSQRPIRISVDATDASRRILHSRLEIPTSPGALTLYYPKWLPADHSPDGPISNVAGLKFSSGGKHIAWRQDPIDMYAFHVEVPANADSVTVELDFLLSAPGPTIDFSASGSAKLLILMWSEVLLYPSGYSANDLTFIPSLKLPADWKFATALPVDHQSANTISFKPLTLDLLIDSPVQSSPYMRVFQLTPDGPVRHELDVAAEDPALLDIPPDLIESYKKLVAEASELYQSHHYREYHFLLTLSDNVMGLGQEHHESSDDRVPARTLVDPSKRMLEAGLFPHEFTHSWNGQFRRPQGLATPDFQQPMNSDMIWVYEGLTSYLGTILTARSGLWTSEQARENLATIASTLEHRAGRNWRSLQNTAFAAQVLYFSPSEWMSYRRGTDFYIESILLWLEVDVTIRKLTHGQRSLDNFCRDFFGGPDGRPLISTYTFNDLTSALNKVALHDWSQFFRDRLDATSPPPEFRGISDSGWRLVYNERANDMVIAGQEGGTGDFTFSIGLVVRNDGNVQDSVPGMAAFESGLTPYMKLVGVNGRQFSLDGLTEAIRDSASTPINILASNSGVLSTHELKYGGGAAYPHLERVRSVDDYLDSILKPLTGATPSTRTQ
jgi:predicted metalloprotease with PDZ domain